MSAGDAEDTEGHARIREDADDTEGHGRVRDDAEDTDDTAGHIVRS